MITFYYRSKNDPKLHAIPSHKKGALTIVTNATNDDLTQIAKLANIQADDLKDIFDYQEIPRLEKVDRGFLMVLREPVLNSDNVHTSVIMMVHANNNFSIISTKESIALSSWLKKNHTTVHATKLLFSLLSSISEQYRLNINTLQRQVFEVKQRLHQATNADIQKLIEYENILDNYFTSLVPMKQIYADVVSGKVISLHQEDTDLFEDALNSINQSATVCDINLKSIEGLRNAFQIIFTNRLNETVKFLTSATIILTIPTMVASIFGMNIALPFNNHPFAFTIVMGIAVLISLFITVVFRKLHWL